MKKDTKYILAGIGIFAFLVIVAIFAVLRSTAPISGGGGAQPLAICDYHDTHSMYFTATDKGQPATAVSLSAKVYTINADGSLHYVNTVTNGTGLAIAPNVKYAAYVTASGYFPVYVEDVTSCSSTTYKPLSMANDDTSFSLTILNSDGVTKNTVSAKDAIGTGGVGHPVIQIVGGTAYAYATDPVYNHGYLGIAWNTSAFDRSNLQMAFDNAACDYVSTLGGRSGTDNVAMKCNGNVFNGERHYVTFSIPALSGVDPVNATPTDSVDIIYCPYSVAQHTVTDKVIPDAAENNVGTAIGTCQTLGHYYYT